MEKLFYLLITFCSVLHSTNAQDWTPCGTGTNHHVRSVIRVGNDIYVAGLFRSPGKYLAIYHPSSDTWDSLAVALNGDGDYMVRDGNYLYVGGNTSIPFNYVGRLDLTTKNWQDLNPPGWSDEPTAMIVAAGKLFVSHGYSSPKFVAVSYYDLVGGGGWVDITDGPIGVVDAFAWDGTYLYIGGSFTNKGNYITRLNPATMTWDDCGGGLDGAVSALIYYNNKIYAGGIFRHPSRSVAVYDPATDSWNPLDTGFNNVVYALDAKDGFIYAAGDIVKVGRNIVRFNPYSNKWEPLSDIGGPEGLGDWVESLCHDDNFIYAGGEFIDKGNRVAKWSIPPVSVPKLETSSMLLYPDPASDMLHLELTNPLSNATVAVFDGTGKLVLSNSHATLQRAELNVSGLSAGMYFLSVRSEEGVIARKFVKTD